MRRLLVLLAAVVLVGGGVAAVLGRDRSGPFPSDEDLRIHGFAVWPADTVAEAERDCSDAAEWRLDSHATALRFVRDLLRYPKPYVSEVFGEEEHAARLLVNTRGAGGTLGSILEMARFGRCWYVTGAEPREGDLGATLGFVYREDRPHLLLSNPLDVPPGFVGYGDWETEIGPRYRQVALWMPELDPDATGHVVYTQPDEDGVSEIVGASSLAPVPPPPSRPPVQPLDVSDVVDNPNVCRIESSPFKKPEAVIRNLYEWTFDNLLQQVDGFPRYERKSFRHLGGDRWRLVVDDAVLIARIPEIAGRCYKLVSMTPVRGDAPLRRLWVEDASVTFGVDWGGGNEASLAFGTGYDGVGATLKEMREPVTFPRHDPPQPPDVPTYAQAILYKDGHVVSAFYGLFGSVDEQ